MGFDCATKQQKNSPVLEQTEKGIEEMTLVRTADASKLLSMTDNVVIRNRAFKRARHSTDEVEERRQYGRLNKSINELAETAEKFRKTSEASDQ